MSLEVKPNFFTSAAPAKPSEFQLIQIAFANDPNFRMKFGLWLADNFDSLAAEFKTHGRFLTLQEVERLESPLGE